MNPPLHPSDTAPPPSRPSIQQSPIILGPRVEVPDKNSPLFLHGPLVCWGRQFGFRYFYLSVHSLLVFHTRLLTLVYVCGLRFILTILKHLSPKSASLLRSLLLPFVVLFLPLSFWRLFEILLDLNAANERAPNIERNIAASLRRRKLDTCIHCTLLLKWINVYFLWAAFVRSHKQVMFLYD